MSDAETPMESAFYDRDPVIVARDMLGLVLVHRDLDGIERSGRIVEVEAYRGEEDLACHAAKGRTGRTEIMYGSPGRAYVYLIYGMYDMLNAVTGPVDFPSAVLIRAIEPLTGIPEGVPTNGPGRLTRALGVTRALNGVDLAGERLRLLPGTRPVEVGVSPRIGVDYAGEWASRPWRFFDASSRSVSKPPRSTPR